MARRIKGHTVLLKQKVQVGTDPFGQPEYETQELEVDNILIMPLKSDDEVAEYEFYGKNAVYKIAIPKGDTHVWEGQTVNFFDKDWTVYTYPLEYYPEDMPLDWYKEYYVERY